MSGTVLSAVIYKEENMYIAECLEVGTVSQGTSIKEALKNLKEISPSYKDLKLFYTDFLYFYSTICI